jgi:hypothetical protein
MFSISEKANRNYLAKVIEVKNLRKHNNADKLQIFTVDGNNVITGLDAKEGDIGIYFPLECAIAPEFLSATNSFREPDRNNNQAAKGFFEYHGRVKAIKLRGEKSEGYYVPFDTDIQVVLNLEMTDNGREFIGTEFDTVNDLLLVKKYIPKGERPQREPGTGKEKHKRESSLIEGQFRLHDDTSQLGKNMHRINPTDDITISYKLHGTSFVSSNILCKRKLSWGEKVAKWFGVKVQEEEYRNIYSSRKVVKNDTLNKVQNHYYSYDLWSEINDIYKDTLPKGITVYGEAVGFTKDGAYIQKGYDYSCSPTSEDRRMLTYLYRITYTNVDGKVFEFSYSQIADFCAKYGFRVVPLLFKGKAKDLFPINLEHHWQDNFLSKLKEHYLEKNCWLCSAKVPLEGIVLRKEGLEIEAFKLKSFNFLERESKELDKGEADLETQESE